MFGLSERARAELALRETEQRYRTLIDVVPDAVFTVDASGTITSLSPSFEETTGWDRAEWIGVSFMPLIHPEDRASVLEAFGQATGRMILPAYEMRIVTKSGGSVAVEVTSSPVHEDGTIVGFLGVARNVTDRRRAENELQRRGRVLEAIAFASERFLAGRASSEDIDEILMRLGAAAEADWVAVFQNAPDEHGDVLASSRHSWIAPDVQTSQDQNVQGVAYRADGLGRWVEVLGTGGVIVGQRHDFAHEEQRTLEALGIRSIVVVPIFVSGEWWGSLGFAQMREERTWSSAEIGALRTAAGILGGAIQQDRATDALRGTEDRYRRLVELSPDAIVVLRSGVIEFANASAARLVRARSAEEIVGTSILKHVHAESRPRFLMLLQRLREGAPVPLVTHKLVRQDGSSINVEIAATPFQYEGESAVQLVARDATDRLKAAAALTRRNEYLASLHETSLALMNRLDVRESLEAIVAKAAALIGTEHGFIYLVDQERNETTVEVALGAYAKWVGYRVERDEGLAGRVWSTGEPLVVNDFDTWEGRASGFRGSEFRAAVGVPLKSAQGVVGVLGLGYVEDGRTFSEATVELLTQFAGLASIALDNARLYTDLQHELSERGRIEEQLRHAEAKFRTLVERIPAITYTARFGEQGRWLYVSPQIEAILGFTPEEWTGRPDRWFEQLHPDDRERVLKMEEGSRRNAEPMQCEYRLRAKDDHIVWVRDDWVVGQDDSGEPVLQGVIFDITERKQAEEQLREAEAKYRTLVEQIPAISYVDVYDPTYTPDMYRTAYVSPQIETMIGYPPEEFTGSPELWYTLVHPDDRERVLQADEHHYRSGRPLSEEYRVIAKNGRIVWILDEAAVVRDEQGEARFSQGILYDITSRKKAEEDLERALSIEREAAERLRALDEMKNTFLHAVSHELRTPLSVVLGLAVTLEREEVKLPVEERKDLVRRLASNARKLDQLLSDLLDLDRLDRGIMEPRRRPTDVAALVRRTVENSDILGTRPVRVSAQLVVVSVDAPKVERIVENLLANAARHTPPGTTIWVGVAPQQDGVLITIEDDGPGITENLRESIFEPFRQGPGTPSHSPGVGIGLSLVAKFAELHGGHAWVDDRPGGGASFKVFLPGAAA